MTQPPPGYPPPYGPPGPYVPRPQPYSAAPPPYPYPPPPPATNWWAIVSLVFGILGGVLISVVCGIVALNKTKSGFYGGRGMAIAGLVLSGVWVLIFVAAIGFYFIMGRGSVNAADVKVGDCLAEIPDSSRVSSLHVVPCEQPHNGEVFTVLTMSDGDFPGQAAIEEYQGRCEPELAVYSPAAAVDPAVGLFVLYPTEESWADGDRAVTCIATSESDRTGSLNG